MAQADRRHSRRVAIEGYVFSIDDDRMPIVDLSLGGMRVAMDPATRTFDSGSVLDGRLMGPEGEPIDLQVTVTWADVQAKVAGLAFNVMGQSLVDRILAIMMED